MNVLGLWDGHDAGAALLREGRLVVAVNEERLSRRKLDVAFPSRAIDACLAHAGLAPADVHVVAASTTDPAKTLARWWPASKERYYAIRRRQRPPGALTAAVRAVKYRMTEWAPGPLSRSLSRRALAQTLRARGLGHARLRLVDHHDAHAAGAAWGGGPEPRAILTVDGLGDGASATISAWRNGRLRRVTTTPARHSLGILFEHVTSLLNMRELEDEGKVMALADYAAPIDDAQNPILDVIAVREGRIETRVPGHALRRHLAAIQWRFPNEQFAFLAQRAVERTLVSLALEAIRLTNCRRLGLAGGVASNVKATRQVRLHPDVEDVFVMPHMGDGGLALGAALLAADAEGDTVEVDLRRLDLGPEVSDDELRAAAPAGTAMLQPHDLARAVATRLDAGQVVMWFQGRMEYGPRSLGHRSVLARPDRLDIRDRLNLVLKRRVWYQPFCPSMLASEGDRLLADPRDASNPCMTMAYAVSADARHILAGVTSVDGTCRPQFIADDDPSVFAIVLREARQRWSAGVVLNTSFNIHGEPVVCTPREAVDVFRRSGADALALGPYLLDRASLTPALGPER